MGAGAAVPVRLTGRSGDEELGGRAVRGGATINVSIRLVNGTVEPPPPLDVKCRPDPRGDTMTDRLLTLSDNAFTQLWNQAQNLDEAVERVREVVGKVPRWAVMAKASALRRQRVELKRHELRERAG
jgi:hypothetical protein